MTRAWRTLRLGPFRLLFLLWIAGAAAAEIGVDAAGARRPGAAASPDAELSGRDIYQRVLDNRFDTFIQVSTLTSGDRAGSTQDTEVRMWFESYRGENGKPKRGRVLSKTLVRYLNPFDLRHTGYLVINNFERVNDQYIYRNSSHQVRRVNLRGEAVFGTDFSFEDVIPRELEEATYVRLPDDDLGDRPCFVVEAMPLEHVNSEYSKFRVWVEKERPVVLQALYWDDRDIEIKKLDVEPRSIELINEVWVARRMSMRNLKSESFTRLSVSEIQPNVPLQRSDFDLTRLVGH